MKYSYSNKYDESFDFDHFENPTELIPWDLTRWVTNNKMNKSQRGNHFIK
jgi:hypothetical protein